MVRFAVPFVTAGALASASAQTTPKAPEPRRASVLLITLDTTRADALGCGGGPAWATPNLDRIAAQGVRFAAARAPAPITLPAHASILTGLFPFQHGVRDNGTFVLPQEALTLAERLKEAGFATAAVPAAYVVDSSFGLAQGFDRYFDLVERAGSDDFTEAERSAAEVVTLATEWLAKLPAERPFFLWAHFFDAHFPYHPADDLRAAHPFEPDPRRVAPGAKRRDEQNYLYQLEVAGIDRELPRLLAALDRFGGVGPVIVAVLGDHGEGLGEHGEATHSALVHDATLRVPFFIAGDGLPAGKVVAEPVTTVDFTPTLLDVLALPAEHMAGADLRPLVRGEPLATNRPLYAETCATWFSQGWRPLYTLIDDSWKIVFGRSVSLFDLAKDPLERRDVADAHEDVILKARERMDELAQNAIAATRRDLDDASKHALDALGYLGDARASSRGELAPPGWQPKDALTPEEGLKNQRRYSHANDLWREGKREEALTELLELVKLEPENSHYTSLAATLLVSCGRAKEALPFARKSVELAESGPSRLTLVAVLVALHQEEEALREAKTTVELFPKLPVAKLRFAELLIATGRSEQAIEPLEAFLKEFAGDPTVRASAQKQLEKARAARDSKPAPIDRK